VGLSAWYQGFGAALHRVAAAAGAAGADLLADPSEILVLFDKRACHARLAAAGVPVPPGLPDAVASYEELRAALRARSWGRVFVKPAHGSSASGVVALQLAAGRVAATTSVELVRDGGRVRLYNSLRVRRYADERDVATIVDALAPDGLQVERWFPKAGLAGRVVDLRVLVVAGRPTHVVVRASRTPMTNLHLGGRRGDLDAVRAAAGEWHYAEALGTCVRVAALFPRCLQVGIDLMFSSDWRRHAVAEVNAFGDLLPGLLVNGRDTYAEQIRAVTTGRFAAWRGTASAPAVAA
jgi:glutathione synthase/RimK-type ligase-like ATP-grasp enzyme